MRAHKNQRVGSTWLGSSGGGANERAVFGMVGSHSTHMGNRSGATRSTECVCEGCCGWVGGGCRLTVVRSVGADVVGKHLSDGRSHGGHGRMSRRPKVPRCGVWGVDTRHKAIAYPTQSGAARARTAVLGLANHVPLRSVEHGVSREHVARRVGQWVWHE